MLITETVGDGAAPAGSPNTAHTEHITRNGTGFLLFLTDTDETEEPQHGTNTRVTHHGSRDTTSRNYGGLNSYSK